MNRRHFIKLSAAGTAALLFSRLTSLAQDGKPVMDLPLDIYAVSGSKTFRLLPSAGNKYSYDGIEAELINDGEKLSVFVQSPKWELNAIRFRWIYDAGSDIRILGDHFERSYGDLAWRSPVLEARYPWYALFHDGKDTACFGVKTGCNSICTWDFWNNNIELTMDTRCGGSGVHLGHRKLHVADIIAYKNAVGENAFVTAQRFCRSMCDSPRLTKQPVYGINDWYFAYGNNSAELIKKITGLMTDLAPDTDNRPFSVIDAGWATYSPLLPGDGGFMDDFSKPNDKFGDMTVMADDIKKLGMRPGLWTRPLCAKHNDRASLLLPKIPGRDDPKEPILDPSIAENIERVKHNISLYRQWGYQLVKHDYTTYDIMGKWGFQMKEDITTPGWSFADRSRTTAEIINHLYGAIREAAGDMYIIGCNTMSHLSAGVFEMSRIGDDTSGKEWARTKKMGVNTLGFRICQHNAFYATDGDCVGLTTDIPWAKNKQWMQLLAESSTPLFISPQPDALGGEQKSFIKQCYTQAAKQQPIGQPLDWLTNQWPGKWKLNGKEVEFDWG